MKYIHSGRNVIFRNGLIHIIHEFLWIPVDEREP